MFLAEKVLLLLVISLTAKGNFTGDTSAIINQTVLEKY